MNETCSVGHNVPVVLYYYMDMHMKRRGELKHDNREDMSR
jgi:hypothetical protein